MSVQHESPPSTAHHSHHHSGHTFPATPVDGPSPADSYEDPDALTTTTTTTTSTTATISSSMSASHPSMPHTPSHTVTFAHPSPLSLSASSPAIVASHFATSFSASSPSLTPTTSGTPSTSPSSSANAALATHSSSSPALSSVPSSYPPPSSAPSSSSPSPPVSAIDRLRPSLQMYRNQVAGHSPLFWHSGTICKPLIPAEYTFYAQLEDAMPAFMPYVPKFYGLLDLEQLTEEMASSLLTEATDTSNAASNTKDKQTSGGGESIKDRANDEGQDSNSAIGHNSSSRRPSADDGSSGSGVSRTSSVSPPSGSSPSLSSCESSMTANSSAGRIYNKWAMKCQLRKPGNSKSRIQYIVLEDLTYAYAKPCILDLKVGTRQHSDTEPPSKIASKTARCLHTTSHSLGLRLCGMQVYHPAQDKYQFRDKYWGRGLDVDGFRRAIRDYFWDGERVVEEVVRAFVARMEKMRRAVTLWTRGRRFYSSSLLLVYEGDRNSRAGGSEQEATSGAIASASGSGQLDKPTALRQGSDSSVISTGSGFFSPLPSPVTVATSFSPGSRSSAASASIASRSTLDSANPSVLASSSPSLLNSKLGSLSSSVPSLSLVPTTRATLPASFSSAALSSTFLSAQSNTPTAASSSSSLSSSSSTSSSVSSGSAGSTPLSTASSLQSAPIKLYSHKRKTTHAQAMALARQRGSIDVRIIDFAHTSVVGEAAVVGGPVEGGSADEVDSGLLFGFDCLLELLRAILEEEERLRTDTQQQATANESKVQRSEPSGEQAKSDTEADSELAVAVESGSGTRVAIPAESVAVRASSDRGVS